MRNPWLILAGVAAVMLGIPVLLLLGLYAEEDLRWHLKWNALKADFQSRGESLDLKQVAPPGDPRHDLSKSPLFSDYYKNPQPNPTRLRLMDIYFGADTSSRVPKLSGYQENKPLNLGHWQIFYTSLSKVSPAPGQTSAGPQIVAALQPFAAGMDELDAAVTLPGADWPLDYEEPYLTKLGGITGLLTPAKLLQLRGIAELDAGVAEAAKDDFLVSTHLEQPLKHNSNVIKLLVLLAIRAVDNAILWEGIHRHAWNADQLRSMDAALAGDDTLVLAVSALRQERAQGVRVMEYVSDKGKLSDFSNVKGNDDLYGQIGSFELYTYLTLRPNGWHLREMAFYARQLQQQIDAIDPSSGTIDPGPAHNMKEEKDYSTSEKINYCESLLLLVPYHKFSFNVARGETYRREARLACLLEEFRLAQGHYPDALKELPDLPQHLNQEVLTTKPLHYARKGDSYVLYSTGWDGQDHGGKVDTSEGGREKSDWVWFGP